MFKKSNVINHWFLHRSYDLFFRLLHFKQLALNFWLSSKYFPPTAAEAEAVVLWREMQCNARQTTFGLLNCFIMSGFCCYWAYWLIWENCKKWVEKIYERKESREIWLHSPHQTKWRDSPQIPQILGNSNDLWESIYQFTCFPPAAGDNTKKRWRKHRANERQSHWHWCHAIKTVLWSITNCFCNG